MRETLLINKKELIQTARAAVAGNNIDINNFNQTKNDREIFELQKRKQIILNEMHQALKKVDNKEGIITANGEINRETKYDAQKNIFYVDNNGTLEKATLGDLITDASYGIEYNFNVAEVPRAVIKKYCLGKARAKISNLFDLQLLNQAEKQKKYKGDYRRADMFARVKTEIASGAYEKKFETSAGLIFEKNIINLIKQLEYDLPQLEIKVEEVDIIKDMDKKIDFIITVKNIPHHRAVRVDETKTENENRKRFGIQFTLNPTATAHKIDQINRSKRYGVTTTEKIDDLLLITVPVASKEIISNYQQWKNNDKKSGGPEGLFSSQIKIHFLKELLNKIGHNNIIEVYQDELEKYYKQKQ